jgi:hypothetical protein
MKLSANQISHLYESRHVLDDMLKGYREKQGGEPENDDVYNELNAALGGIEAALELALNNK